MDKLKILSDAGIDSFKIEGRLRRAGYVATATKVYREAIDNLGSKNYNFESAKLELKKVFCRGNFNDSAYLYDNFKKLQTKFNSHTGVKIGNTGRDMKEDFVMWNLQGQFRAASWLRIWARGENLLAQRYEINDGFPMPKATVMAGMNINF